MEKILTELEAKQLLTQHGIPVTKQKLAKNPQQAVKFSKELGHLVVMKIVSPDIVHKTEAKGVAVGIDQNEVEKTYNQLIKNAKKYKKTARIHGISIQQMATGKEIIIGSTIDPQFGHTIMFGLGGIFVEVLKDVTFRVVPIKRNDALEMLTEIKSHKILEGVRGEKPVSKKALVDTLMSVSKMLEKNPQIKELDINPLFVNPKGVVAADARIVLA